MAGAVIGLLLALIASGSDVDWRDVFSIGIFRLSDADLVQGNYSLRSYMEGWRKYVRLLFYEDAADATVSVELAKTSHGHQ